MTVVAVEARHDAIGIYMIHYYFLIIYEWYCSLEKVASRFWEGGRGQLREPRKEKKIKVYITFSTFLYIKKAFLPF